MDWLAYYEDRRLDPDWSREQESELWDEGDYYDDRYDELD